MDNVYFLIHVKKIQLAILQYVLKLDMLSHVELLLVAIILIRVVKLVLLTERTVRQPALEKIKNILKKIDILRKIRIIRS